MSILLLSAALLAGSAMPVLSDEPVLRTAAELDSFSDDTRRRYAPFCVTGTVQAIDVDARQMTFSDSTGRAEVRIEAEHRPVSGDTFEITGFAHMSASQETDFVARELKYVGKGIVSAPLPLRLGDISEDRHHLCMVVTEGTVIDTFPDEIDARNQFLILKDEDVILPVSLPAESHSAAELDLLRDAGVRVKGLFRRTVSGGRKFSGPFISAEAPASVTVLVPAPADPFAAPPLEKNLYRTPREIAKLGKRTVSGEVLAAWGGSHLMLRDACGRIANVSLAHGQSVPTPGEFVTAAGYPKTDLFRVNLSRAVVRAEKRRPAQTQEPEITDLQSVFTVTRGQNTVDYLCHGRLMRLRGIVRSIPAPEVSERRLLLACGSFKLPVELGGHPEAAANLSLESEVEVVGRCLLEIDSWRSDDIFPRIRNLVLVIRTPNDIRVVTPPPWWTPRKLLLVITGLVLALVAIWMRNRVIRHLGEVKVAERTRLAVELHDSLSQTLAGVACQIAASDKAIDAGNTVAKGRIKTAELMLQSCRTELRHCLFDLRSDMLEEKDFTAAIRKTLDQLDGDADISVRFNVPRSLLDDATAHATIAIVRELVGNALRHGNATKVRVAGSVENRCVRFSVTDNGGGFDPARCAGSLEGHFGLEGIRNRVKKLGGTFEIRSVPDKGTVARLSLPLGG